MTDTLKKYPTIGCCGIDCGLCPRFYTEGDSRCPGCGGLNFKEKHPSCGLLSCCAVKNGLEVCSECKDYPCDRFESEKEGFDSFVTHKKIFENLDYIKNHGLEEFISNQKIQIDILQHLIKHHDEGRSKSFFCLSCSLLPVDRLKEIYEFAKNISEEVDLKERNRSLRLFISDIADSMDIDLKLRKKYKGV